ncbi:hypothetical protein EXIGLDRAFT_719097 [Exidia glandulosa HHB12029]|uniref:ZZ-type domain-containing protein n=1 Tax=Exidia glandulosa HHB12029 TaxID=1314781 RepID=A0A165HB45_EXIGL|nr:hypothetical protein EXIGLDRAFT_719097 [Exidia glandulosa HHB12029]
MSLRPPTSPLRRRHASSSSDPAAKRSDVQEGDTFVSLGVVSGPGDTRPESGVTRGLDAVGDLAVDGMVYAAEQSISAFAETSQIVMKGLDIVQESYPFIGAVLLAFKAAIELELTRRENDKKILVLKIRMVEMMEVLLQLANIRDDADSVATRLQRLLLATEINIRDCSALCEKYMQKRFIVKLFDGLRWESRLADFDRIFVQRKQEILFTLTLRSALELDSLRGTIASIDAHSRNASEHASMLALFRQLDSPLERELRDFINAHGGPKACAANETLFQELQSRIARGSPSTTISPPIYDARAIMATIQIEMQSDLTHVLAEDRQNFNLKFDAVQQKLEEVNSTVYHNGNRIISAMRSGPHDGLLDPDMRQLWKDMAWRGSIRASQFVVGVQDYFRAKATKLEPLTPLTPPPTSTSSLPSHLSDQPEGWAINYVTLTRWRPILEAFDDDTSGWISISNVNSFTSGRPANYSVLKWIAYWAAAFRVVSAQYAQDINVLRVKMNRLAVEVLPCNRARVQKYISSPRLAVVDHLVRSILQLDVENDPDLSSHFSDYVAWEERRLEENLVRFQWHVDASNTLSVITGGGRIERYILPIIRLVLRRHAQIIQLACKYPLNDFELYTAENTIDTLSDSVCNRLATLTAHFQIQNLNVRQELAHAYHGMFSVLYSWSHKEAVTVDDYEYPGMEGVIDACPWPEPDLDVLNFGLACVTVPSDFFDWDSDNMASSGPAGSWVGHYISTDRIRHGWTALSFQVDGRSIYGTGRDTRGTFEMTGILSTATDVLTAPRVSLKKLYTMRGYRTAWRYDGEVTTDADGAIIRIHGHWGNWSEASQDLPVEPLGSFSFHRSNARRTSISREGDIARSSWDVLRAHARDLSRDRWSWAYFRQRRDDRTAALNAYIRIFAAKEPRRYSIPSANDGSDPWTVLDDIQQRLGPQDTAFCRWLAERRLQQVYHHTAVFCAKCRREPIEVRFRCLDCVNSRGCPFIDLCTTCVPLAEDTLFEGSSVPHLATHSLMKTRRVLPHRDVTRVTNAAKRRLHALAEHLSTEIPSGGGHISCRFCRRTLSRSGSWVCVECVDHTFICETCEGSKRSCDAEGPHPWWHIVVKLSGSEASAASTQPENQSACVLTAQQAETAAQFTALTTAMSELRSNAESQSRRMTVLCFLYAFTLAYLICGM